MKLSFSSWMIASIVGLGSISSAGYMMLYPKSISPLEEQLQQLKYKEHQLELAKKSETESLKILYKKFDTYNTETIKAKEVYLVLNSNLIDHYHAINHEEYSKLAHQTGEAEKKFASMLNLKNEAWKAYADAITKEQETLSKEIAEIKTKISEIKQI